MRRIINKVIVALCCLVPLQLLANQPAKGDECVILLHGLGRTGLSMLALERRLSQQGFVVVNVTYPSLKYPIQALSPLAVDKGLDGCREQGASTIHVVTHSLGGILLRQYLVSNQIDGLSRVVMLGPPNQGSQLADTIQNSAALQSLPWLQSLQPPAAAELVTGETSVPILLGAVNFELGIIAGTNNHRPFIASRIKEPNDGTVTVNETKVEGMKDFIQLPTTHTFMMWNESVLEQTLHFLNQGQFNYQLKENVRD